MKTFIFVVFILMMAYLVIAFIVDTLRKGFAKQEPEQSSLYPWLIPAIITALVAQGLLSIEEADELENTSFDELEDYLLNEDTFHSTAEFHEWMKGLPEMNDGMETNADFITMDSSWE